MQNLNASKLIALKLNSLNKTDFDWIYSRLDDQTKSQLNPLIQEIRELGFDVDASEIDSLIANDKDMLSLKLKSEPDFSETINKSNFKDIQKIFKNDSVFLLVTLIKLQNWLWNKEKDCQQFIQNNHSKIIEHYDSKPLLTRSILSTTAHFLNKEKDKNLGSTKKDNPRLKLTSYNPLNFLVNILK